jgi:23S rRNA pseudouridine2605 synthase
VKGRRRIGLARALSKLGFCSRSVGSRLARAGRVEVNGMVRQDPEFPIHLEKDHIAVDGQRLEAESRVYLMMNKPRGVVTTASDEKGRETVYAHLDDGPWVAPVGRLDKASEGLLLLTNDSEWGSKIASPESHLEKTYHVQIAAKASSELLSSMRNGVSTDIGILRARRATVIRQGEKNTWLQVVLDEGKNRQIRRILQEFGIEVLRIVRVAIGPLPLGDLPKGKVRRLSEAEKSALDLAITPSRQSD